MSEQTDTPRTDEISWIQSSEEIVEADFARQLERELAAVTYQRDRLAEALNDLWHHYSLTEAAYNLIEKSLATVGIDNPQMPL